MVKTKEQFEQEVYRLLSLTGKLDAKKIDGIGINYDRETRKHKVSVVMLDGSDLVGKEVNFEDAEATVNMFTEVADTVFSDNGVLLEPTT